MSDDTRSSNNGGTRNYLPAERQDMILSLLTRQSVATVSELAALLNTTPITVRRDLTILSKAGLLKRVRGGAMSVGESATSELPSQSPLSVVSHRRAANGAPALTAVPHQVEIGQDQPAIGVLLPEPSFFWPGVIEHMQTVATRYGLRVITRESTYEPDVREDLLLDEFADDPTVCGVIAAPSAHPESSAHTWKWIKQGRLPVLVLERDQPLLGDCFVDSVRTNHYYGVRKAAIHFLAHGHTVIGAAFSETPTSKAIGDGWRKIINESDAIDCPFVIDGVQPYDAKGVRKVVDEIIRSKATAVLVHSDYLAIAIAQGLERRGRQVPKDVSLISIDGFATPSSRPLTVLRSPQKDLATACIHTLINRVQNPDMPTTHIFIDPKLVDRGSVATVTQD